MQTNTFNMLLVWSKVFVLFVELFPSTGVLWVIGVRMHISIFFVRLTIFKCNSLYSTWFNAVLCIILTYFFLFRPLARVGYQDQNHTVSF